MENRQTSLGGVFPRDKTIAGRKVLATTKQGIELKTHTYIKVFEISLFAHQEMEKSVDGFPLSSIIMNKAQDQERQIFNIP
jgi:hypothetical protein